MEIHTMEEWDSEYGSPQAACADAMAARRPFVMAVNVDVATGDLLLWPDFFVTYQVLRHATEEEKRLYLRATARCWPYISFVVLAEPPQEKSETATADEGVPVLVRLPEVPQ